MTEWRTGKKIKPANLFLNEAWVQDAVCTNSDPEVFHPEKWQSSLQARLICLKCPVQAECLAYALRHNETGVWGGKSENQRRALKRLRRRNNTATDNREET